jgi:hypothetical protein
MSPLPNPNGITQGKVNRKPQTAFREMGEQAHPAVEFKKASHWNFLLKVPKFCPDSYSSSQMPILVALQNLGDLRDLTASRAGHIWIKE